MKRLLRWTFVVALAVGISDAFAWNGTGHESVASIAWQNLTTTARAKAAAVLGNHPRLKEDLQRGMHEDDDPDEFTFRNAATWPDIVRTTSNPLHGQWHKPKWHYIDFAFSVDGSQVSAAPSETFTSGQEPDNAS